MAVAQSLKPCCAHDMQRTKLAMQHIIATNVIRSFTFSTAVVKQLKQVIMLKKSLNIIRASNCNYPSKRLQNKWAICTIPSFYYYDQNPSGFCSPV